MQSESQQWRSCLLQHEKVSLELEWWCNGATLAPPDVMLLPAWARMSLARWRCPSSHEPFHVPTTEV